MKIRSIRLREVGCFNAATAVEHFSGALDVLSGPNELGKSTLLKALWAVLFLKHTAVNDATRSLRPYAGGAPLIEADIEVNGAAWRIRKQFLSEKQAVLTNLVTNQVAARGEEAHAALLALLGEAASGGTSRFGLVFVRQGDAISPDQPEPARHGAVEQAIATEIEAAISGGARALRQKVTSELASMITEARRSPKAGSAFAQAIGRRDALARETREATVAAQAAAERLDQLARWRVERAVLAAPERGETRQRNLYAAKSALEEPAGRTSG